MNLIFEDLKSLRHKANEVYDDISHEIVIMRCNA